jgi:hypothetical protein
MCQGLKPDSFGSLNAALKRRSSTVLSAFTMLTGMLSSVVSRNAK